jgi:hypothetical protein
MTLFCFLALLISGLEIVISHPRFYWGEVGNVNTRPLFTIPIPSSRGTVPTGYGFVMPDANGWSRYLHFQTAWALVLTGLIYVIAGMGSGHFRKNLIPEPHDRRWRAYWRRIAQYLRSAPPDTAEEHSYNVLREGPGLGVARKRLCVVCRYLTRRLRISLTKRVFVTITRKTEAIIGLCLVSLYPVKDTNLSY